MNKQQREKGFRKLLMWQKADELVKQVYKASKNFPREEQFGITSQLRRASLSVALNIVEGFGRQNKGDFGRFLDIAYGSIVEVEYILEICRDLDYLSNDSFVSLEEIRSECGKLLWSYRNKLRG